MLFTVEKAKKSEIANYFVISFLTRFSSFVSCIFTNIEMKQRSAFISHNDQMPFVLLCVRACARTDNEERKTAQELVKLTEN